MQTERGTQCGQDPVLDKKIPSELTRLREAVTVNRKLLEELGSRLGPLIANVPRAAPSSEKLADTLSASPIADELRQFAGTVHEANDILRFLMNVIEI